MHKDGNKARTHLQLVSMSLLRKKKETSPKSSASTIRRRTIIPTGILKKRNKNRKTSDNLGNLQTGDYS